MRPHRLFVGLALLILIGLTLTIGSDSQDIRIAASSDEEGSVGTVRLPIDDSLPSVAQVAPEQREEALRNAVVESWRYEQATLMPDGNSPIALSAANGQIAYIESNGRLYLMNPDGVGRIGLTSDIVDVRVRMMSWSRDSTMLAYVSERSDQYCLNTYNVATRTHAIVVCGFAFIWSPQWSPQGSRIVFFGAKQPGDENRSWSVDANGANLTLLAPDVPQIWSPSWLDEDTVLLPGATSKARDAWRIYRVDISTPDTVVPLSPVHTCSGCNCGAADWAGFPVLSPDGQQIAYIGGRTEGGKFACTSYYGIYVIPAAGAQTATLLGTISNTGYAGTMSWAPDGTRLAAYGGDSNRQLRLNIVSLQQQQIVFSNHVGFSNDNNFDWAPDGQSLVVGVERNDGEPIIALLDPAQPTAALRELRRGQRPAWSTIPASAFPEEDIEAYHMEVTQATQNERNNISLVENKRTWVRVYVRSTTRRDVSNVTAWLYITKDGQRQVLRPVNNRLTVRADGSRRNELHDTFNFSLPAEFLSGTVELRVEVAPDKQFPEPNYSNNVFPRASDPPLQIRFTPYKGIHIFSYRLRWVDKNGKAYITSEDVISSTLRYVRAAYPISETGIIVSLQSDQDWPVEDFNKNSEKSWMSLLSWLRDLCDGQIAEPGTIKRCIAWVPYEVINGSAKYFGYAASPVAAITAGQDTTRLYQSLAAHELGHTFGLEHPAAGPDSCLYIDQTGFSGSENDPFVYSTTLYYDFMHATSRCGITNNMQWVTTKNYKVLQSKLATTTPQTSSEASPELSPEVAPAAVEQPYLTLSGIIQGGISTDLLSFYSVLRSTGSSPGPQNGTYRVELLDGAGQILRMRYLDDLLDAGESSEDDLFFRTSVLLPPGATRVILRSASTVMLDRVITATAPRVQITTPLNGATLGDGVDLSWQASDADGDPLVSLVEFSSDNGQSWRTVGFLQGGTSLRIDTRTLPGTTQGKFRVQVSDGLRSAFAVSDGVFTISPKPPSVSIIAPQSGEHFPAGIPILLSAVASNQYGQTLTGNALVWRLDDDTTTIGTGNLVTLKGDLRYGSHRITLTVTDREGRVTKMTTTIVISDHPPSRVFLPMVLS